MGRLKTKPKVKGSGIIPSRSFQRYERPKENAWKTFMKFIRKQSLETEITRKELLSLTQQSRPSTIDHYRWIMIRLGILEKKKPGLYVLKREVKKEWTYSKMKRMATLQNWEAWFLEL